MKRMNTRFEKYDKKSKNTTQKKKIAVVGGKGKMGSAVCKKLAEKYEIFAIDRGTTILNGVNLVIDFGSAQSSVASAKWCSENKVPLIIGATGQTYKQKKYITKMAINTPIVISENFAQGLILFKKALYEVINENVQDIIVFEKHHRQKKDLPSGTAKNIVKFIENNYSGKIQVISERGGQEIGTHIVDVYFDNEVITLSHKAFSRDVFAVGVCRVVDWFFDGKLKENRVYSFDEIK